MTTHPSPLTPISNRVAPLHISVWDSARGTDAADGHALRIQGGRHERRAAPNPTFLSTGPAGSNNSPKLLGLCDSWPSTPWWPGRRGHFCTPRKSRKEVHQNKHGTIHLTHHARRSIGSSPGP